MSRCQHCHKLTHSEDLIVEYDASDHGKVHEISRQSDFRHYFMYGDGSQTNEYGRLKVGDIYIYFRHK